MNPEWEHSGGRLRLLKTSDSLDDPIMEVPPAAGTLLTFKRSDKSCHGHKPFSGERRVIQFNWVTSEDDRRIAMLRHQVSARQAHVRQGASAGDVAGSPPGSKPNAEPPLSTRSARSRSVPLRKECAHKRSLT